MKRPTLVFVCVVLFGLTLSTDRTQGAELDEQTAAATSPKIANNPKWSAKMQELYKTLADLLTDVSSASRFFDPANQYRITNEANKLAVLSHDLNKKGMVSPDSDPSVPLLAALLSQKSKQAAEELKMNNRVYARALLKTIPSYCITCHTRNATGPNFSSLPFEPTSNSLTEEERGEFYAATRQFDRAQSEFMKVLRDPKAASSYNSDWGNAVHQSLAIAVRAKKDPEKAQEIVQTILSMKDAPSSTLEDAKVWKTSIEQWQAEPPHQAMTVVGLHAEALRLMGKAREIQKYPMDRTADVYYLRASAAAHDLLQAKPEGEHLDDALLLAGLSYEVLSPLKGEDLHDFYYEACIRRSPHSTTANLCYKRYEQSELLGYTGSAGTDIPEDVLGKLIELRTFSEPLPMTETKP